MNGNDIVEYLEEHPEMDKAEMAEVAADLYRKYEYEKDRNNNR